MAAAVDFYSQRVRLTQPLPGAPNEPDLPVGKEVEVMGTRRHPVFGRCLIVRFQAGIIKPRWVFAYVPPGMVEDAEIEDAE
jgi:hypothetical protein